MDDDSTLTDAAAKAAATRGQRYNAVVLDAAALRLARGVDAAGVVEAFFFYDSGAAAWSLPELHTRQVRRDFLRSFKLDPAKVPLLRLRVAEHEEGAQQQQPVQQRALAQSPFELVDETDLPTCGECWQAVSAVGGLGVRTADHDGRRTREEREMADGGDGDDVDRVDCSVLAGCHSDRCDFCANPPTNSR